MILLPPAGARALANIRRRDQRVSEPSGPPADRAGEARRGAGQWEEVLRWEGQGPLWWPRGSVTFEPWPLVSSQLSKDADAAAKDKGNSSAISQGQAYWQYVVFSSLQWMLLTFVWMDGNTQLSFPTSRPELAYNDEQIHKSEKWVCNRADSARLTQASERFCPELCCNLLVTCTFPESTCRPTSSE